MAKVLQGVFGGFSGSMGNVTGASWKGINYMRLKAVSVANPQTAGQVAQRTKFSGAVSMAKTLLAVIVKPLWDRFAVRKSGYNDMVGSNSQLFDSAGVPDYPNLVMSKGKMAKTAITTVSVDDGQTDGFVTWVDDTGEGFKLATDEAYLVLWNETQDVLHSGFDGSARAAGSVTITMPTNFVNGDVVHAYLSFRRIDGTVVSGNSYLEGLSTI